MINDNFTNNGLGILNQDSQKIEFFLKEEIV